jgi:hypothetical protein
VPIITCSRFEVDLDLFADLGVILTPAPGDADQAAAGSRPGFKIKRAGMLGKGSVRLGRAGGCRF